MHGRVLALVVATAGLWAAGCGRSAPPIASPATPPPVRPDLHVLASTANDTLSTIVISYSAREELLPLLRIELEHGGQRRRLRGEDLTATEAGDERWIHFDVNRPDSLRLRVRASLVRGAQERDTVATASVVATILPGRLHRITVRVSPSRPFGWFVDDVAAAPLRDPTLVRFPGDSFWVTSGYQYKGGPVR